MKNTKKSTKLDTKKHPRLWAHLSASPCRIFCEGDENGADYIGIAADGQEVNMGQDPDQIEAYLNDHPTPRDW